MSLKTVVTLVAEDGFKRERNRVCPSVTSAYRSHSQMEMRPSGLRDTKCCKANGWDKETPVLKLPTLLEGEALAIWLELSEEQQGDYATAKKVICDAIMPMEFVSLDGFHQRKLRPGEALSVFVHDLKKLLEQAIPGLDKTVRVPGIYLSKHPSTIV